MRFITTLLISVLLISSLSTASIIVAAEPVIYFSRRASSIGLSVSFTGGGFLPTDTTCVLSSPSSNGVILSSACVIPSGTGTLSGGFTVGNVLPGEYLIQVMGDQGDFAQALLEVSGGSQLSLSHASVHPGTGVSIRATGLLPTDTTCQLSSPSQGVILHGTSACAIQSGTGVAYGGFIVGNVLPGQYVIQVTGNQGDFAQTILAVG